MSSAAVVIGALRVKIPMLYVYLKSFHKDRTSEFNAYVEKNVLVCDSVHQKNEKTAQRNNYRFYSAIRRGFPRSRMSTDNQIRPMQFCCNTRFTLPKQPQRSRSIL